VKLLDLYCKAGGAAMGYHRAGFEVVGVDIEPQPHYPFEFHQADAMTFPLAGFDAIHASPPCQRYSTMTKKWGRESEHPDLVDPTRERLLEAGVPFVIENVPAAPLRSPVTLCGSMFQLELPGDYACSCGAFFEEALGKYGCPNCGGDGTARLAPIRQLRRHRAFETSFPILFTPPCAHAGRAIGVYGHAGGSSKRDPHLRFHGTDSWRAVMGIDWMTGKELAEAIPPAYTEFVGRQLMAAMQETAS